MLTTFLFFSFLSFHNPLLFSRPPFLNGFWMSYCAAAAGGRRGKGGKGGGKVLGKQRRTSLARSLPLSDGKGAIKVFLPLAADHHNRPIRRDGVTEAAAAAVAAAAAACLFASES